MASTGGPSEAQTGVSAAVSTSCNISKLKRTPVILNPPRKPPGAHFKVLQWNVLADGLAQNGDFCRVHPDHLEWEYRKPLLLQEIMEANADIICLQELNHFEDLAQVLKELGYEGAFREKHASPALKYEYPPDGMAVFYRSGRFTCSAGAVEGRSFQDDCTGREQSQGYLQILLHDLVVGRDLLVVTTHLKAKDGAECEDMRYQQAKQLLRNVSGTLERLEKVSQEAAGATGRNGSAAHSGGKGGSSKTGGNGSSNGAGKNGTGSGNAASGPAAAAAVSKDHLVPVLVTGDFNTLPGSKTCRAFREHPLGLMSLWEQRPIDATLSSGSDMDVPPPTGAPSAAANGGGSTASAGASSDAGCSGPTLPLEFSTWKFRVKGESKRISDYIYFSGDGLLRPLQRWRMLTEEEIGPTALPSSAYASDHVSLCCEFEWDVDADLEWAPSSKEPDWG
ncbi:hypothetical protein HYH02_005150 [Chlamydomonas schloesseri]|uniref:Endonuclease/exonuclease/phosphatase domain-containing protein n=1 Tax=Chlamydomonas schloesseri TaxID=2026947 RepID=A0A836B747_9CHLO|nr:hypothetical protein HYH02_005150 [Chlamydomonas schloesseri]|eukprot:KAG2449617.1 hypothetical protein HYH02_005150 [Chlamydomonas schloesseri]